MLKNSVLVASLLLNGIAGYWLLLPTKSNAVRMSCAEATSETLNKKATLKYARENNNSLSKTQDFLRASDYKLRNITIKNGQVGFVYTAKSYPQSCGLRIPGIDGSIVRIKTDLTAIPTITGVN